MADLKLYSMDDVGTRLEHYMDLQDIWSFGLGYLTRAGWHSDLEKQQAAYLTIALELLAQRMEEEYKPIVYAQEINALPKDAKDIPDKEKK
jgi:hypothetical protein